MRRIILAAFLFEFILLSCDDLIEINDPYVEIEQIIPNPANIGDTVSIFLKNFNYQLNVENIDQVKVILFNKINSNKDTIQATGYYDDLKKQEYGNFYHSNLTDSLARSYQQVVQFIVDSSYPSQSTVGVRLNDITTISKSSIILIISK
ncbi:hypothetical protein ACSSWA_07430 [Melioribacter sp. Ez-97]|uniref:hypothetical protein n=1 Tax=Melioribacter sp. Ez-97 TaxID=3423434 RepID=UPI003ED93BCB